MVETAIGVSEPRPVGKTVPVLALEVAGLKLPVAGGLGAVTPVGLGGRLERVGADVWLPF